MEITASHRCAPWNVNRGVAFASWIPAGAYSRVNARTTTMSGATKFSRAAELKFKGLRAMLACFLPPGDKAGTEREKFEPDANALT